MICVQTSGIIINVLHFETLKRYWCRTIINLSSYQYPFFLFWDKHFETIHSKFCVVMSIKLLTISSIGSASSSSRSCLPYCDRRRKFIILLFLFIVLTWSVVRITNADVALGYTKRVQKLSHSARRQKVWM